MFNTVKYKFCDIPQKLGQLTSKIIQSCKGIVRHAALTCDDWELEDILCAGTVIALERTGINYDILAQFKFTDEFYSMMDRIQEFICKWGRRVRREILKVTSV